MEQTNKHLKQTSVVKSLGPNHCNPHLMDRGSHTDNNKTEHTFIEIDIKSEIEDVTSECDNINHDVTECKIEHSVTVKIEPEEPPASNECDNMNMVRREPLKYEVSFGCTICLEEFVDEHTYNEHMITHLQSLHCQRELRQSKKINRQLKQL
ncbi:uncharacterized protein LOC112045803 isoform X2 [Bicyclus anynana]|uniref:Uncharacterized protein LOC112045803 isoform X2 n=1 Tax=Bicyclus anynana TaxID=110368 RepID=A0A6J1N4S0_BICAN|nr:uncharacterized protein LOC112045803 isoform X2 [Bicyclus anynana]